MYLCPSVHIHVSCLLGFREHRTHCSSDVTCIHSVGAFDSYLSWPLWTQFFRASLLLQCCFLSSNIFSHVWSFPTRTSLTHMSLNQPRLRLLFCAILEVCIFSDINHAILQGQTLGEKLISTQSKSEMLASCFS